MNLTLAYIGPRSAKSDDFAPLTEKYVRRTTPYFPCESATFRTEEAWIDWLARPQGRIPVTAVFLDSRGRQMTSEAFASWLGTRRDEGVRHIAFAIGPADGWSDAARKRASLLLSLGPMTLAHSLARVVLAEQLYRACTILAGHPYHTGH